MTKKTSKTQSERVDPRGERPGQRSERPGQRGERQGQRSEREDALCEAIAGLKSAKEAHRFLLDLCTPAELRAMADRWKVARLLAQEMPYRKIQEETGVSTATVTRVARALVYGDGGYRRVLEKHGDKSAEKSRA